jgi:DNA-binding PadR family transcriptional regulator
LGIIYKEEIFDAIKKMLFKIEPITKENASNRDVLKKEDYSLTYSELYNEVTDALGRKLSHDDFSSHLKKLVLDESLNKEDTRLKGSTKVFYSLTEKGRRELTLKVQHVTIDKREKAYQLLLLYCAFNAPPVLAINYDRNILEDDQSLERFLLKEFGLTRSDFKEVKQVGYNRDLYRVIYFVKKTAFPNIRYQKIEYLKGSRQLEGKYEYRYILPGISVREFLRGIKGGRALEHIPQSMSQVEAEECFRLLKQDSLIEQVLIFHGEPRYDLVDNDLRVFLQDCWVIHGISSITMNSIWENVRMPTQEERKWYEMLWSKRTADIHFNNYYESLKDKQKDTKKKGYRKVSPEIETRIKDWGYKGIVEHFKRLNEQHRDVIQKYRVPSAMLMKMVYPEFLRDLIDKNEI